MDSLDSIGKNPLEFRLSIFFVYNIDGDYFPFIKRLPASGGEALYKDSDWFSECKSLLPQAKNAELAGKSEGHKATDSAPAKATDFFRRRVYAWDMRSIYADSLFLLNAAVDYLLLLSAGKLCALPLRRWRIALGALWGGAYALACVLLPGLFTLLSVKLLAGALAVAIAYGLSRRTLRAVLAFYAVSAAFAGAVYAAATLAGRSPRDGLLTPVSPRVLLLSFALCYAVLELAFRRAGRRAERRIHTVSLRLGGRSCTFPALEDSGNELADPVSGDGVLVAEAGAVETLFPGQAALAEPDPLRALEALNGAGGVRWRLLSCSCVAAGSALLPCFRPEELEVDGRPRRDLVVALSPNRLCPDGEYQGILPPL